MNDNKKIWIISIALIVIALVIFGAKFIQVENEYNEEGIVFETPTVSDAEEVTADPVEPEVEVEVDVDEPVVAGGEADTDVEEPDDTEVTVTDQAPDDAVVTDPVPPATAEPVTDTPVVTPEPVTVDPVNPVEVTPVETVVPEPVVVTPAPVTAPVYVFRNQRLLNEHYEKHGIEMGFASAESYQAAASAVITNPNSLFKIEAEDGDGVYYLEATNEFVVLSTDGYIRTYFLPSSGKAYFDRQ